LSIRIKKNRYKQYHKIKNDRSRNKIIFVFYLVLMSAFCILCHDFIINADYFAVKHIEITGNNILSKKDVLNIINIKTNKNLLGIRIKTIKNKLLNNPWVKDVEAKRKFPDILIVKIEEKKPLTIIQLNKARYIIDETGSIIKEFDESDNVQLDLVKGFEILDFKNDSIKCSKHFKYLECISKSNLLNEINERFDIRIVKIDKDIGFTLYSNDNRFELHLGFDNYYEKFYRLHKLINFLTINNNYKGINFIDISDINRAIVRKNQNNMLTSLVF